MARHDIRPLKSAGGKRHASPLSAAVATCALSESAPGVGATLMRAAFHEDTSPLRKRPERKYRGGLDNRGASLRDQGSLNSMGCWTHISGRNRLEERNEFAAGIPHAGRPGAKAADHRPPLP
jgi:hypothetical protein